MDYRTRLCAAFSALCSPDQSCTEPKPFPVETLRAGIGRGCVRTRWARHQDRACQRRPPSCSALSWGRRACAGQLRACFCETSTEREQALT